MEAALYHLKDTHTAEDVLAILEGHRVGQDIKADGTCVFRIVVQGLLYWGAAGVMVVGGSSGREGDGGSSSSGVIVGTAWPWLDDM